MFRTCMICGKQLIHNVDSISAKRCKGITIYTCGYIKDTYYELSECQKKAWGKAMKIGRLVKKLEPDLEELDEYIKRLEDQEI